MYQIVRQKLPICHPIYTSSSCFCAHVSILYNYIPDMFLVAPPSPPSPSPPLPPPPPHANACTGHNFVTNTPIKFIFAIAIKIQDYKNPMIFVINRKNKMASWRPFCIKMLKKLVASLIVSQIYRSTSYLA